MKPWLVIIVLLVMISCTQNSKIMNRNNTKSSIEQLSKLINLNPLPQKVEWEKEQIGRDDFMGKANYNIYGILDYRNLSEEEYNVLFDESKVELFPFQGIREWMPKEIKEKLNDSIYLNNNSFIVTNFDKYPYDNGFVIRFKKEQKMVLYMHTALNQ